MALGTDERCQFQYEPNAKQAECEKHAFPVVWSCFCWCLLIRSSQKWCTKEVLEADTRIPFTAPAAVEPLLHNVPDSIDGFGIILYVYYALSRSRVYARKAPGKLPPAPPVKHSASHMALPSSMRLLPRHQQLVIAAKMMVKKYVNIYKLDNKT